MVMVSNFSENSGFNLSIVYELITLIYVGFNLKGQPKNRIKIPYFGVDRAIISASHNSERRGIRIGGGQIPNSVALDLQYANKNIHIKINKNNFLSMGILNETMGEEASNVCLEHIKMISKIWDSFLKLSSKEKDEIIEFTLNLVKKNEDQIYMYDDEKIWNYINTDLTPRKKIIRYLTMFTYEYNTYHLFKQKMSVIKNINTPLYIEKFPKINDIDISNSIYNYNMNITLPMVYLSTELNAKQIPVLYNNWLEPNVLYVMLPVSILHKKDETDAIKKMIDEEGNIKNVKKKLTMTNIKAHRFQINKKGSIRQTSPSTVAMAFEVRNLIVGFINEIVEKYKENNKNGYLNMCENND